VLYLLEKRSSKGDSALLLLVAILRDRYSREDFLWRDLNQLYKDLHPIFCKSQQTPDDSSAGEIGSLPPPQVLIHTLNNHGLVVNGGNVNISQGISNFSKLDQANDKSSSAVEIFFSYSHKDKELRDELAKHLSNLKRKGVIAEWYDRQIPPGKEWEEQINDHINTAQIILLLVSSDFIASDYCWKKEVQRAMQRYDAGEAVVIPIILRPVDWEGTPFHRLQGLPQNVKPVTLWQNQDEAFLDITQGIKTVIKNLK